MADNRAKVGRNPTTIPSNLAPYVMKSFPPLKCPWSLSGPQFPNPAPLQQRYCYPRGDTEYASQKGGSLWTIVDDNGKEDFTYRLLHVYFSEKRANSITTTLPSSPPFSDSEKNSTSKLLPTTKDNMETTWTSPKTTPISTKTSNQINSISFEGNIFDEVYHAPPRKVEAVPELQQAKSLSLHQVTPADQALPSSQTSIAHLKRGSCHVLPVGRSDFGRQDFNCTNYCPPSQHLERKYTAPIHFFPTSLPRPVSLRYSSSWESESNQPVCKKPKYNSSLSPREEEMALLEFETFWTDPLRLDQSLTCIDDQDSWTKDERMKGFSFKLGVIHRSILEKIAEAPEDVKDSLVNILCSWAKDVAKSPMHLNDKQLSLKTPDQL